MTAAITILCWGAVVWLIVHGWRQELRLRPPGRVRRWLARWWERNIIADDPYDDTPYGHRRLP